MHNSQITDVVLAVLANNHQLRLPQFFVVGDLVVVSFAFADLEHAGGTIHANLKILELVSIHSLEVHVELVCGGLVWQRVEGFSLQADSDISFTGRKFSQVDSAEILVVHEFGKARVFHNLNP